MGNGIRNRAVKKMLWKSGNKLLEKCHWCKIVCVWWQKLPKSWILNRTHPHTGEFKFEGGIVRFVVDDKKYSLPIVSVDHVCEVSKGGRNEWDNLVLSCVPCNSTRSTPPHSRSAKGAIACIQCGSSKKLPSKKRCKRCLELNKEYFLEQKMRNATIPPR